MFEKLEYRRLLSSSLVNGLLTVTGTSNKDTIALSLSGSNIKVAQNGTADKLFATAAVQKILINALGNNDTVTVGPFVTKPATINGGGGNDSLFGGGGPDVLNGGDNNDQLHGGGGKDALHGGNGDDLLDGGTGDDFLDGQGGSDSADYSTRSAKITAEIDVVGDPSHGVPVSITGKGGQSAEHDTFSGVETVLGGSGNDVLKFLGPALEDGGPAPHFGNFVLNGQGGNDQLSADGTSFVDDSHIHVSLFGGNNNDEFSDNPAIIRAFEFGGAGNDTFDAFEEEGATLPGPRIVDAGSGTDTEIIGSTDVASVTMGLNLENLSVIQGRQGLSITGNSLKNKIDCSGQTLGFGVTVDGGGGDDSIIGTSHADKLTGGAGHDTIKAGGGSDTIFANDGLKDVLDGGPGSDKAKRDAGLDSVTNIESFL